MSGYTNGNGRKQFNVLTLLPISVVVSVMMAVWAAWVYLDTRFGALNTNLQELTFRVRALEMAVDGQLKDIRKSIDMQWTRQDMKIWEQDLKIKNPAISVPDCVMIARNKSAGL